MTIADLPTAGPSTEPPLISTETTPEAVQALREVIFGPYSSLYAHVRDIISELPDPPSSGETYTQKTQTAPAQLSKVIARLGRSASEIAADTLLRGALCDWAQVAAPRLLLVLTGHFDLAIGAILALGDGSAYQQQCLDELNTGATLGVLMLTELGGTNGADQQTTATWDPVHQGGGFWLHTPSKTAIKFMPNVADPDVPKTVVVTARLVIDGRDEGVLPFLLRLRTATGLADGVEMADLPDKLKAPMDHAMIRFNRVWVPREALLGGEWARMTNNDQLESALNPRQRFHAAINVLGNGRLDLANAAIASARAALAGLVNYANDRQPGNGTRMADRDAIKRDLASAIANVYVTSVLGRRIRDMRAAAVGHDPAQSVWSMLAKPLLSDTAYDVVLMCRQTAGAQGTFTVNHLVEWLGNTDAIQNAEGINQLMLVTAGKSDLDLTALRLPGTPVVLPWYIRMLIDRERIIHDAVRRGDHESVGAVLGRDSAAIERSTATVERLAATAMYAEALAISDPTARTLALSAAEAYALERIDARGTWYNAHGLMPSERAVTVQSGLRRHYEVLAEHVQILVDAFHIPALPGPIFNKYIEWWTEYAGWGADSFSAYPAGSQHQRQ
ncbi:acyl-CoA dehydrogenase family protein [Nocardia sp. Marseille-Q1738]